VNTLEEPFFLGRKTMGSNLIYNHLEYLQMRFSILNGTVSAKTFESLGKERMPHAPTTPSRKSVFDIRHLGMMGEIRGASLKESLGYLGNVIWHENLRQS
jgi:hypothetical protein